jgi:hypothetical protein
LRRNSSQLLPVQNILMAPKHQQTFSARAPDERGSDFFTVLKEGVMKESEQVFTHATCGGNIRRDANTLHYICDRCHAEAEAVISSAEKTEGQPEEVILCNPHDDAF